MPIERFGEFELDERAGGLKLRGSEVRLQPRVLALLAYLLRHRERVVDKDELLEALWPGVVVTDGSLQRAVSLARSALQAGGLDNAIRTYARRGYRFCATVTNGADTQPDAGASTDAIAMAHRAMDQRDWDAAIAAFEQADAQADLEPVELERLAQAAQWAGKAARAIGALERAIAAHLCAGDRRGAARAAFLLAEIQFERLEIPVARGWLRRAETLLDDAGPCRELGLVHYLAARLALLDGSLDDCRRHAERAHALGLELGEDDLEALGLLYRGHASLSLGDIQGGVACLDEAAACALTGNMTPWIASVVYCGVIWACRNRGDWDRAAKWTDSFARWCERHSLAAFPGTCRLHHAEVLSVRGELDKAAREIAGIATLLAEWAPWAEGDAYRVLGDLRLAQGDLDAAEQAYRQAHSLGWDPQPGYAMLQLARGETDAAMRCLERALAERNWAHIEKRGVLLADLVIVAVAAGRPDRARAALAELESHPDLWSGTAVEAMVMRARGEVDLLGANPAEAVRHLRESVNLWRRIGSPVNAAVTQLRLGELLHATDDHSAAALETTAARAALERLGAAAVAQTGRHPV